jgi:hypothetical protein
VKVARLLVVACLLTATWAHAIYVVVLKDGSRVVAREKYEVKGNNAVVRLKNGALTSIPLAYIDMATTERINAMNLGDAVALEALDGEPVTRPTATQTPSVAHLGRIRQGVATAEGEAALPTPTPGITLQSEGYRDPRVDRAFQEGLERYKLYLYRTSRGTRPEFLFIEVQVSGQSEVYKSLQAVATTYHVLTQSAPERAPEQVEIQMLNEARKEAGLFRINATDAAELATGKVSAEDFYLKHVIF